MNMLLPEQKDAERYASVRARMKDGTFARKMNRAKGARHCHAAMRASGRVPGQEAREARKRNAAARRLAKQQDVSLGKQWRQSSTDLTGI